MRMFNTSGRTEVTNQRETDLCESREAGAFDEAITRTEEQEIQVNERVSDVRPSATESQMTITATSLNAALKYLYAGQAMGEVVYNEKARPFMTMLKKFKGFEGVKMPFPLLVEDGGGRSISFSKAQANVLSPTLAQWLVDVVRNYDVARIETEAMLRSGSNKGSFVQGVKLMVDSAINRVANDIESSLFRDGSGSIGTIGTLGTPGNKTITLTSASDSVNFWVGQKLVAADTTASALRSATASTVASVDRINGIIVITENLTASCDGYLGDLLFNEGDYDSASDLNKISGLDLWFPASTPAALFGVTRTSDRVRYAGVVTTGSSSAIEESIEQAAADMGRESGSAPDTALVSFSNFKQLVLELGAKVQRSAGAKGTAGFQGVEVYGPRGIIKVVPCTFCPDNAIYLLTLDTMQLVSMGEPIRILDQDGLRIARVDAADALEVRIGSWCQLVCTKPAANCRIVIS